MNKGGTGLERMATLSDFGADVGHHQHQQEMNDVSLLCFLTLCPSIIFEVTSSKLLSPTLFNRFAPYVCFSFPLLFAAIMSMMMLMIPQTMSDRSRTIPGMHRHLELTMKRLHTPLHHRLQSNNNKYQKSSLPKRGPG
jgi:hypothetical protein